MESQKYLLIKNEYLLIHFSYLVSKSSKNEYLFPCLVFMERKTNHLNLLFLNGCKIIL